jgi:hypothetical protein
VPLVWSSRPTMLHEVRAGSVRALHHGAEVGAREREVAGGREYTLADTLQVGL